MTIRILAAGAWATLAVFTVRAEAETPVPVESNMDQSVIEAIVVTAQRRSERLVDVPLSITVLNESLLSRSGVSNAGDLERLVPGLAMPLHGGFVQPSIRGISSTGSNPGDQSNVATYIDGVYLPSQSNQLYDLSDVESIEVLKGPQGSLYGQNAAGGAIIIKTRSPTFESEGSLELSYGNLDDRYMRGFIAGPLSSTVAASLSAKYQERDGFNRDIVTGRIDDGIESSQLRGKLLWQPSEGAEILFGAYWFDHEDSAAFTTQPLNGNALAYQLNPTAPRPTQPWEIANNPAFGRFPTSTLKGYGASLQGSFDLGAGTWRFVSAYSNASPFHWVDLDGTNAQNLSFEYTIPVPVKAFTQELTFASNNLGNWRYTAGLFYMNSKERFANLRYVISGLNLFGGPQPPVLAANQNGTNTKNSAALFGEVEYTFDSHWSVIAGLRYAYETQLGSFDQAFAFDGTREPPGNPEVSNPNGTESFEKTTPRVSVRYAVNDDSNVYATFSQGFKSGIVDVQNLALPPVKPEVVTAYEVGYKGAFLDRRLQIDAAVFRYDYEDMQVQVNAGGAAYRYLNAAQAQIDGFEAGLQLQATASLQFGMSLSYLDGQYDEFQNATVHIPIPGGGNFSPPPADPLTDVSGNHLIRTPEWTGHLNGSYTREFASGVFSLFAGLHHSDGFYWDPENLRKQDGHTLVDAEVSWSPLNSGLSFSVWGENLTDKAVQRGMLSTDFGDTVSWGAPRTYGIRLGYKF